MATSTDIEKLPSASELPNLPDSTRATVLDLLFEPSTALHSLFLPLTANQSFTSYDELIKAIQAQLTSLAESAKAEDQESLESVLSSHPRLGEKKVDSKMSRLEQAAMLKASGATPMSVQTSTSAGQDEEMAKAQEAATLKELNEEYEEAFPGLRYVVFVAGRSRNVIFQDMRKRIGRGDIQAERVEGIQAMCDIANDRVKKLT